MGFRKQCRQIAKLCVAQLRGEQVMDLETIVNSLEMWMVNVPDDPDERMLCHLIQSAPGEIKMHQDWAQKLADSFDCPLTLRERYRYWRLRHQAFMGRLITLGKTTRKETRLARCDLRADILLTIQIIRTRESQFATFGGRRYVAQGQRQNALLLRNALAIWRATAQRILAHYEEERRCKEV